MIAALAAACLLSGHAAQAADSQGPWMLRARALGVVPDESSTISIGGEATASDTLVPEIDITYFWTDNWATELILATTPHEMGAKNTGLGNLDLGDVWLLPPTLTLQYHFTGMEQWKPYIGAGLNYTFFYAEDAGSSITNIEYDDGIGYALQAGVDIPIEGPWAFNIDVKKIWLNTDASINSGGVTADVDLDPWLVGIGVAYRF